MERISTRQGVGTPKPMLTNSLSTRHSDNLVCVNIIDEERGLVIPKFVKATHAKHNTHMCGITLGMNIEESIDSLFAVYSEELKARSVCVGRVAVIQLVKEMVDYDGEEKKDGEGCEEEEEK